MSNDDFDQEHYAKYGDPHGELTAMPTREQIADYSELRADLATMARQERTPYHWAIGRNQRTARSALTAIDTLLALLQKGADR